MSDADRSAANALPRTVQRALATRNGQGAYSTTTFRRLLDAGLVNGDFRWTEKGFRYRRALFGSAFDE